MCKEKITSAINTALSYLENSIQTLTTSNSDEKAVADSLWLASSEVEYALFLFSLMTPDDSATPSWKHGTQLKQVMEAKSAMVSAQEQLRKARSNTEAGVVEKAYEEAWTARNHLLKAQECLEKKRRSVTAQSTRTR